MGRPRKIQTDILQEDSNALLDFSSPNEQAEEKAEALDEAFNGALTLEEQVKALQAFIVKGQKQEVLNAKLRDKENKTVKVMFFEGKPVVKFGKVYPKRVDNENKEFIDITVVADGENGPTQEIVSVEYLTLINEAARYLCIVVSEDKEEKTVIQGPILVKWAAANPDPAGMGGKNSWQHKEVELTSEIAVYVYTVEFIEGPWAGKKMRLDSSVINP